MQSLVRVNVAELVPGDGGRKSFAMRFFLCGRPGRLEQATFQIERHFLQPIQLVRGPALERKLVTATICTAGRAIAKLLQMDFNRLANRLALSPLRRYPSTSWPSPCRPPPAGRRGTPQWPTDLRPRTRWDCGPWESPGRRRR